MPGVGDKTAAKWLTAHGDLPGVLENAESIGGKVGEKLRDHITEVERNYRLNRLLDDVDLGLEFDDLAWGAGDPTELSSLFDQLEFKPSANVWPRSSPKPAPNPSRHRHGRRASRPSTSTHC